MSVARYFRLTFGGDYNAGAMNGEIWQTGLSFVNSDGGGIFKQAIRTALPFCEVTQIGDYQDSNGYRINWAWEGVTKLGRSDQLLIANCAKTYWETLKTKTTTSMRMQWIKLSAFDANGKTINGSNYFDLASPIAGTVNPSSQLPAQLAIVASLRTGARGPGGRGRMYLPLTGTSPTNGIITSANQSAVLTATKGLIDSVNAIGGSTVCVVNAAKLTCSGITQIEVGDMYDVQRRRSQGLTEARTSTTVG